MAYPITVTNKEIKDGSVKILIERSGSLALPRVMHITIKDKEAKYRKLLDNKLFDPDNKQKLLNDLTRIHGLASDAGGLQFVCTCTDNKYHGKVLKEFFEANIETFEMILPYVCPDLRKPPVADPDAVTDDAMPLVPNQANISARDMESLMEVIRNREDVADAEVVEDVTDSVEAPRETL